MKKRNVKYTNSFILMLKEAARAVGLCTDSQVFKAEGAGGTKRQRPNATGRHRAPQGDVS